MKLKPKFSRKEHCNSRKECSWTRGVRIPAPTRILSGRISKRRFQFIILYQRL